MQMSVLCCVTALVLVEQSNIYRPTSYYHRTEFQFCDNMMAHGHCRHPKFKVVLSLIMGRRFSRHQRPHIYLVLYTASHYTRGYAVCQHAK